MSTPDFDELARNMVHAWVRGPVPLNVKMSCGPADLRPLMDSIAQALRKAHDLGLESAAKCLEDEAVEWKSEFLNARVLAGYVRALKSSETTASLKAEKEGE